MDRKFTKSREEGDHQSTHDRSSVTAKLLGETADFSYELVEPSFAFFRSCRVDVVWSLLASDEAGENTDSLGRDLGA